MTWKFCLILISQSLQSKNSPVAFFSLKWLVTRKIKPISNQTEAAVEDVLQNRCS